MKQSHALAALALPTGLGAFLIGPVTGWDVPIGRALDAWRLAHPAALAPIRAVTDLGSAYVLIPILGLMVVYVLSRADRRAALPLLLIVMSGRLVVELTKLATDRPRPAFSPHPIITTSSSFPSGHAGNSMLTFLAIAMLVVPRPWRREAVVVALVGGVAVGMSRPLLGVHWMSDVMAGWAFAMAWVAMGVRFWRIRA